MAAGHGSVAFARLPAALASILAIAATYLLARRLYGPVTAIAAMLLLGVDRVFLHFSRIEAYMDPIPFHALSVLGLVAGLQSGSHGWFVLAGLAGGYSALTYHAGRITPPVLVLLTVLALLRYPRLVARRWSGLLLAGLSALAVLGPQVMVYFGGQADPYGRSDQFTWVRNGVVDVAMLKATILNGFPHVFASFWLYPDTSTQYGGSVAFHPLVAALLGVAVAAAFFRFWDVRGIALVLWTSLVLFVGGVLTLDPPFWPRLVTALVPAILLAASVPEWIYRGAGVAVGRPGKFVAAVLTCLVVALSAHYELDQYRHYALGTAPGSTKPGRRIQWPQSRMGRDMQQWRDAMVYIVAPNPIDHSCEHPIMKYFAIGIDVQDARDLSEYLPFDKRRTAVAYILPGRKESLDAVLRAYPNAETKEFLDEVGAKLFTRIVVRPSS
jgi:4-amino-4-deoxy-L-arabinose transferase-like glycosyltransferase